MAKSIPLTQDYVATVSDEDFERVKAFKWCASITRRADGAILQVYAKRGIWRDGKEYTERLHRFILGIDDPQTHVDHRDHDGLNCQRENLRIATASQNIANRRKQATPATSRFKGVYLCRSKWIAQIMINRKMSYLGSFTAEEEAAAAYLKAARGGFGEFAYEGAR